METDEALTWGSLGPDRQFDWADTPQTRGNGTCPADSALCRCSLAIQFFTLLTSKLRKAFPSEQRVGMPMRMFVAGLSLEATVSQPAVETLDPFSWVASWGALTPAQNKRTDDDQTQDIYF